MARRIVVNDRDSADELAQHWGISRSRIQWLPLPIDTDYYRPKSSPPGDYVLVPGDTKRDEAFVRELAEAGAVTVVRSVKDGTRLQSYTGSPAVSSGRLVIKQWEVFSKIRLNTQHALAVILPLENCPEPVGLTALLESMACGRAVIVSAGRAARDHVVHGETGFILEGDRSTWVEQVHAILSRPAQLEKVGERARSYVVAHHSFAAVKGPWRQALGVGAFHRG